MSGPASGADDVAVVGGGPAGALAALLLARRGWQVRLFDRARFPRPKLCGDTLNPGALAVLARHLDLAPLAAMGHPIRGMRSAGPAASPCAAPIPTASPAWAIARADLDAWLLAAAARAGVGGVRSGRGRSVRRSPAGRSTGVRRPIARRGRGRIQRGWSSPPTAAPRRSRPVSAWPRPPRQPRRWAIGAYLTGVTGVRADYGEMHVRRGRYLGIAPMPVGPRQRLPGRAVRRARTAMRDPAGAVLQAGSPRSVDRVALHAAPNWPPRRRCSARWPWTCRCRAPRDCCSPATPPASSIR